MNKIKTNQKGMTLIEVLIVMVIVGVLIIPMWQLFDVNNTLTVKQRERSEAKNISVMIQDYISNELKMASIVSYSSGPIVIPTDSQCIYLSPTQGLVHKVTSASEKIVFNKDILAPYQVDIAFEQPGPGVKRSTEIVVTVKKDDGGTIKTLYQNKSSVQSINILKDANKIPVSSGSYVVFTKPY